MSLIPFQPRASADRLQRQGYMQGTRDLGVGGWEVERGWVGSHPAKALHM